jgi:hypothetical protein
VRTHTVGSRSFRAFEATSSPSIGVRFRPWRPATSLRQTVRRNGRNRTAFDRLDDVTSKGQCDWRDRGWRFSLLEPQFVQTFHRRYLMFRCFKICLAIGLFGSMQLLLLAYLSAAPALVTEQTPGALAFVVNKANPVDNLPFEDLRKIFLGERSRWPNGKKVTLVMQDEGKRERETVLRQLYHMTENDYSRYLLQATFTGSVQRGPKLLSTAEGVVKFVSFVPGAIGYVYIEDAGDSVKVIRVDGLAPRQRGYKFNFGQR